MVKQCVTTFITIITDFLNRRIINVSDNITDFEAFSPNINGFFMNIVHGIIFLYVIK